MLSKYLNKGILDGQIDGLNFSKEKDLKNVGSSPKWFSMDLFNYKIFNIRELKVKITVVTFIIILLSSSLFSFGIDLSIENMQGGSEERVTFRKINEEESISFNVVKSDPTNPESIRIWNAPEGSQFQNGVFSWTPDRYQAGMYNISFSILDQVTGQFAFSTIRIVVDDTCFSIRYEKTFEYLFTATDPDNDRIELTIINLPQGATFTGGQFTPKLFKWRPTRQQLGNHQMTIVATDFPESGQPKQDISIIYIKVSRLSRAEAKFDHYIDDKINMDDYRLFAVHWLKGTAPIIDPVVFSTVVCAIKSKEK